MSRIEAKKFPEAARRRIADLEAQVEEWRTLALPKTQAASNVALRDPVSREPAGLPHGATVSFAIGGDWLDVEHAPGGLRVYWRGTPGRLAVFPESGNVLTLAIIGGHRG